MPFNRNSMSGWTAAGIIPKLASNPASNPASSQLTPLDLQTNSQQLNDPTLGSRQFTSIPQGMPLDVAAQTSVYATPNIPSFLYQALGNLNTQQSQRSANFQDIFSKVLQPYLQQTSAAYSNLAGTQAEKNRAQIGAIQQAQAEPAKLAQLQQQRAAMGEPSFGNYLNSPQEKLDQQIRALQSGVGSSNIQRLGRSAASTSGWVGAPSLTLPQI